MKLEVKEENGFRFEELGHKYFYGERALTGVTTVLSVIAKPALIQWAANEAVKYIKEWLPVDENGVIDLDNANRVFEEARTAHRNKKVEAAGKGTDVHMIIEEIIKDVIENSEGRILSGKNSNPQVQKFLDWAIESKVKFLSSEKPVWDTNLFLAGTPDFTAEIEDQKFVGDIKTSSGVYPDHFYQMAAYRMLLESMGEGGFTGSVVVRLGKTGDFETRYRYDYETDKEAFLGALKIYRANQTYETKNNANH